MNHNTTETPKTYQHTRGVAMTYLGLEITWYRYHNQRHVQLGFIQPRPLGLYYPILTKHLQYEQTQFTTPPTY